MTDVGDEARIALLESKVTDLEELPSKIEMVAEAIKVLRWLVGELADAVEAAGIELPDEFDENFERVDQLAGFAL